MEFYSNISTILVTLEMTSGASYEAHKEAAKDDNLSAGTRINHGIDAAKDKGMSIILYNQKLFLNIIQSKKRAMKQKKKHTKKVLKKEVSSAKSAIPSQMLTTS